MEDVGGFIESARVTYMYIYRDIARHHPSANITCMLSVASAPVRL